MSSAAPITALTVITEVDEMTEIAETFATMADELAAMLESSDDAYTALGRMVINRLGALHVELDELTVAAPTRRGLAVLANEVDELLRWVEGIAAPSVTMSALVTPLGELHTVLVDQVAVYGWRVSA
jgi:hypothetical protein